MKTSRAWYLLPLLFGLLGGLIGWSLLKKSDKTKARNLIIIGIIPFIIYAVLILLALVPDSAGIL